MYVVCGSSTTSHNGRGQTTAAAAVDGRDHGPSEVCIAVKDTRRLWYKRAVNVVDPIPKLARGGAAAILSAVRGIFQVLPVPPLRRSRHERCWQKRAREATNEAHDTPPGQTSGAA